MRRYPLFVLLAPLLAVAACSTEGKVTPLVSGTALPSATTWSVAVHGCETATTCEDLRSEIASRLIGSGLAERITGPAAPAPLTLDVNVSRTRTVSGAERVFFGALAGRNEVGATATVKDGRGAVLRSYQVESGSAAHPFSGQSGESDAQKRFATDVISGLR